MKRARVRHREGGTQGVWCFGTDRERGRRGRAQREMGKGERGRLIREQKEKGRRRELKGDREKYKRDMEEKRA